MAILTELGPIPSNFTSSCKFTWYKNLWRGKYIVEVLRATEFLVQSISEYQTILGFKWSLLVYTGHLITGPFEIKTTFSGFEMVH
jgi:hypothetical protein